MNPALSNILSGLVGSVITIILTKVLESRQKKAESERELQKLYFVSKLKAAEEIFSHFTLLSSQFKQLKILFNSLKELDENGYIKENPVMPSIEANINEISVRLKTTFSNIIYAHGLYFSDDNDKELFIIFEGLTNTFKYISEAFNKYTNSIPSPESSDLFDQASDLVDITVSKLDKIDAKIEEKLKRISAYYKRF